MDFVLNLYLWFVRGLTLVFCLLAFFALVFAFRTNSMTSCSKRLWNPKTKFSWTTNQSFCSLIHLLDSNIHWKVTIMILAQSINCIFADKFWLIFDELDHDMTGDDGEHCDPFVLPTVTKWRWCTWLDCQGVLNLVSQWFALLSDMQRFFKILLWLQDCRTPKRRLRLRRFRTSTQWCRPTHSGRSTGQAFTSFICCRGFEQLWMTFLNLANFIFLLIIFATYRNSKCAPQWKNKKWENKEWFAMHLDGNLC